MAIDYLKRKANVTNPAAPSDANAIIKCLSADILAKIFLSVPQDYVYDRWEIHPPHKAVLPRITLCESSSLDPMVLAQVSRRWREVALSTPQLWSSIYIFCSDKQQRVPLLKAWLERSSTCPLTIRFIESTCDFEDYSHIPESRFTSEIMALLILEAHRWKAIDFSFARRISPILSNISSTSLPVIETASIVSREHPGDLFEGVVPSDNIWRVIHSSPSFRSGRWEMEYLENKMTEVPWAQLTSIDVTMSFDSLMDVLPFCQNLVDLKFTDPLTLYHSSALPSCYRTPTERDDDDKISLPKLQNLTLKLSQSAHIILDSLILPSLSSYSIQLYKDNVHRSHAISFTHLLLRSGSLLKRLSYENAEANAEDGLLQILSCSRMSSLVQLDVPRRTTDKLIDFLKRTEANLNTLPCLEELSLGPCYTSSGLLSRMVLSRRSAIEDLASLSVFQVGHWECHTPDLKVFRMLVDEEEMTIDI